MLETRDQYKYIRDKMFGNPSRIAIDANVLGTRNQNRIKRNVDQFYLKELKSMYETVDLENSIEFDYPISSDTQLLAPNLSLYVDLDKYNNLNADVEDVWKYSGGEDPDIEKLEREFNELTENHNDQLSTLEKERDDNLSNLYVKLSTDIVSKDAEISALEETLSTFYTIYDNQMSTRLSTYEASLSGLDKRKEEIDKELSEKTIQLSVWNARRQELEFDYYDLEFDNVKELNKISSTLYTSLGNYYIEHRQLELDKQELQTKYDEDVANELSSYNQKLSSENYKYNTSSNRIYLNSNGSVGLMFEENKENLEKELEMISCYNAHENVKKGIPWISERNKTRYVEYNNRLFADWEKCKLIKVEAGIQKAVLGVMEHYSSYSNSPGGKGPEDVPYPGTTYHDSFARWLVGDMVAYDIWYEEQEDAGQASNITIVNNTFKIRCGNRHQLDNIKTLHLIMRAQGSGEDDGHGFMYVKTTASFSKIIAQQWLDRFDSEDDLNLENIQKYDDKYLSDRKELRFQQSEELYELQLEFDKDMQEIDDELTQAIRQATSSWITGIESKIIEANTLKSKGEDNQALIDEIIASKINLSTQISRLRDAYEIRRQTLRDKNRQDRDRIDADYERRFSNINTIWRTNKSAEDERHRNAVDNITNAYVADLRSKQDAIADAYQEDVEKAEQQKKAGEDDIKSGNEGFDNDLRSTWNQRFKDDEYMQVDDDYSFIYNGVPHWAQPGSVENKWIAQNVWLAIYNQSVANSQASSRLIDEYRTAIAEAQQKQAEAEGALEILDKNARYEFTLQGDMFAGFIQRFSSETTKSAMGSSSVESINIIAAYAEMDYKANTGKTYEDYETNDNAEEEEAEEDDNNN